MTLERNLDNILIPTFLRKGTMKVDINKILKNLKSEIDRYHQGDKSITLLEHEMNMATYRHFKRNNKQDEAKDDW